MISKIIKFSEIFFYISFYNSLADIRLTKGWSKQYNNAINFACFIISSTF